MLTETNGQNLKPLKVYGWFGSKILEDADQFKAMLNEIHHQDKTAANARKILDQVDSDMPDPETIRDNLHAAKDAELRSLYLQLKACLFFRDRILEQIKLAQSGEVRRLQKVCDEIHQKVTKQIMQVGEPNQWVAANEAKTKKPVRDAQGDVQRVAAITFPEYGDADSIAGLQAEIRRVAERL